MGWGRRVRAPLLTGRLLGGLSGRKWVNRTKQSQKKKKSPFHHGVMFRAITCKEVLFLLLSTAKAAAGINFPCFEKAKGHMESAQKRVGRIAWDQGNWSQQARLEGLGRTEHRPRRRWRNLCEGKESKVCSPQQMGPEAMGLKVPLQIRCQENPAVWRQGMDTECLEKSEQSFPWLVLRSQQGKAC